MIEITTKDVPVIMLVIFLRTVVATIIAAIINNGYAGRYFTPMIEFDILLLTLIIGLGFLALYFK